VRALTIAEHFRGDVVPVQVRLSNASGNAWAPDRASPRVGRPVGLGVRFQLPSGAVASWAAVSLPAFPARTPEDFLRLTRAQNPSGQPNPFKIIFYLLSRPSAFAALKAVATLPPVQSFAHARYNGLHTYYLVSENGVRQPFRYGWVPLERAPSAPTGDAREQPKHYLLDELRTRLAGGPVRWSLVLQLPAATDPLDDATRIWPNDRRSVVAGTLTIDHIEDDQRAHETLVFDPTGVVPGIELSADPLLRFRAEVYGESFRRRTSEPRDQAPPDVGQ
jgi:catalase